MLQRKYKTVQKLEGTVHKSVDEDENHAEIRQQTSKSASDEDSRQQKDEVQPHIVSKYNNQSGISETSKESNVPLVESKAPSIDKDVVDNAETTTILQIVPQEINNPESYEKGVGKNMLTFCLEKFVLSICFLISNFFILVAEPIVEENPLDKLRESLIYEELLHMKASLRARLIQEKNEIARLLEMIAERGVKETKPRDKMHTPNDLDVAAIVKLTSENQLLEVL